MNVFRALARELFRSVEDLSRRDPASQQPNSLAPVRQQRVPPVIGLGRAREAFDHRFRDAFEQLPQGAQGALRTLGQERAALRDTLGSPARPVGSQDAWRHAVRDEFTTARRPAIDLSGGARNVAATLPEARRPTVLMPNGFVASLDDL